MKNTILLCALLLTFVFTVSAQTNSQPKVYVASMENGFDSFISAALIKNKVPVVVTIDESTADYIITGQAVKGQNKWYDTVFGGERDRNQGSIKLLRVSDKSIAWAGASGDKSFWWGAMKGGGEAKVSNRLARQLKKEFCNGKNVSVAK
ncbi:MAG: hypothetical protein ACR2HT_03115 [Pyrinomonadaceae bacterium]